MSADLEKLPGADWQRARLAPDAIPITERLPPLREHVLGWVSDERVSIHHFPLVIWRTPCHDGSDEWWGGLPGSYIDLLHHGWTVTHWRQMQGAAAIEAAAGRAENGQRHISECEFATVEEVAAYNRGRRDAADDVRALSPPERAAEEPNASISHETEE